MLSRVSFFTVLYFLPALISAEDFYDVKDATRWDEEIWKNIPGENFARFYIFNVTNAGEYNVSVSPEKPILKEIGPYVYLIKREKFNITQNLEDGSFSFREKKSYHFQPNLSGGRSEDDIVNVVNTALITFGNRGAVKSSFMFSYNFGVIMESGEEFILKGQTVSEVIFSGRNASIYLKYESEWGSDVPPGFEAFEDGRYGLFKGKNESNLGLLRVYPRSSVDGRVGQVISWNDKGKLDFWNDDANGRCNDILGTDGSVFPPNLHSGSDIVDLRVFLPEISRSVPLVFKDAMELGGVSGNRYRISDKFLEDLEMEPDNVCSCTDRFSRCLRRGALDMQTTMLGAPYIVSYPNFMKSDGVYSLKVDGTLPAPSIHETFYDVEPITGTVLESKKRFQWNIRVGPIYGDGLNLTYFRSIPEYVFPLLWVEESFRLDGDIIAGLRAELEHGEDVTLTLPEQDEDETTEYKVPEVTSTSTIAAPTASSEGATNPVPITSEAPPATSTISIITTEKDNVVSTTTTGYDAEKECKGQVLVDKIWISDSFKSVNIHLAFLTVLAGIAVLICIAAIALLVINARAVNNMQRMINVAFDTPQLPNLPNEKEKS